MLVTKYDLEDNKELRIVYDEYAESPRMWDNISTMVCFHNRYNLGDETHYKSEDYNSWSEVNKQIQREHDIAIILPLYMYDHSGITISTSPFSCKWDSGQIGWVFVTKQEVRKTFMVKRVTEKILKRALTCLLGEVEVYDQFLRGEVYGFKLIQYETCGECGETHEECLDDCYGFYGHDIRENGMLDYLSREIVAEVESQI